MLTTDLLLLAVTLVNDRLVHSSERPKSTSLQMPDSYKDLVSSPR
jgi:hypothetical protein